MSTPETPPQTTTTPPVPGAVPAHPEPGAAPVAAPAGNGEPSLLHEASASTEARTTEPDDGDEARAESSPAGDAALGSSQEQHVEATEGSAPPGEKKRRRRRRKKRPGAQGAGDPPAGEPTDRDQSPDGSPDPGVEATPAEKVEKRDPRRKEKKHGPPRERAPVTAGDIVFGKILQVTDDAILIDIPGKARAIFDRREMLLPEDDEAARSAASGAVESQTATAGLESPATASVDEATTMPSKADDAGDLAGEIPRDQTDVAPPAAPSEAGSSRHEPAPERSKEPKVPRVILEVGADFIGVVHSDGLRGGLVVLTHHPNRLERARPAVEKAFNERTMIEGLVTGVIKGGVEVDVDGLRAFAPGSHVDLRLGADLSYLVAQRLPFLVTQYAKRGRDLVLSRKSIIEDEARKARTEALAKLKVGEDLEGVVRSVVPFGAFIDVGGIEGLVPLQEMSHNRADGPSDVFKVGEATRVKVIKVDDKGKVWLSRKATVADPWQLVALKYAQGTRHTGKVARLQPFGAFIELEPGVDGLIHTQDLTTKRIESPGDVVKVGDALEVIVAHLDASQHKIALHPAPEGEAANEPPQKVAPHKPVKAKVLTIESGGLVVRILGVTGRNARGYVTAAGTGTPRGTELRKAFHVGQEVDAKVIEMDPRRGEVKLSIKALSEDQERNAYQQYRQQLKAEARFTFGDLLAKKGPNPR